MLSNDLYEHEWTGARCPHCDKPCKNERGVKIHQKHCYFNQAGCDQPEQNFYRRKTEKAAKIQKKKEAQKNRPAVKCEGAPLDNIFLFKYLGSVFAADGSHDHDITRRITLTMKRYGQLRNVFSSPDVPLSLKLSIYKSAVVSILTYGSEAWALTPRLQARINGANSRCLAGLTGRTVHEGEASPRTQTFDIIISIKQRKWK